MPPIRSTAAPRPTGPLPPASCPLSSTTLPGECVVDAADIDGDARCDQKIRPEPGIACRKPRPDPHQRRQCRLAFPLVVPRRGPIRSPLAEVGELDEVEAADQSLADRR